MTTPSYPVAKIMGERSSGTNFFGALPNAIGAELHTYTGSLQGALASDASRAKVVPV